MKSTWQNCTSEDRMLQIPTIDVNAKDSSYENIANYVVTNGIAVFAVKKTMQRNSLRIDGSNEVGWKSSRWMYWYGKGGRR